MLNIYPSAQDQPTRSAAAEEVRALSVEDPVIRIQLRLSKAKAFGVGIECGDAISDSVEAVHALWSEFIGGRAFEDRDQSATEEHLDALKLTLT